MVQETDEFKVTENWNGFSKNVCVKIVEIYSFDEENFVVLKNDATNMETDILKTDVEKAVKSGILVELKENRKIQI